MEKKPSQQFKDYITENKSFDSSVKNAYSLWLSKYVKKKDKQPQEKMSDKDLITGKIYTFAYMGREKINESTQYVDHRPVLFSMGKVSRGGKEFESGINLNVIPFKPRLMILDRIHKFYYASTIKQNWNNLNNGKAGKKPMKINYAVAKKILVGTGWEMGYMVFDRKSMQKLEIIDYADWTAMCAVYTKAIRGKQIKDIWSEYIKRMAKPQVDNLNDN